MEKIIGNKCHNHFMACRQPILSTSLRKVMTLSVSHEANYVNSNSFFWVVHFASYIFEIKYSHLYISFHNASETHLNGILSLIRKPTVISKWWLFHYRLDHAQCRNGRTLCWASQDGNSKSDYIRNDNECSLIKVIISIIL